MKTNYLKITAIIPVYNGRKFIRSALESVLRQTSLPHEIIIVDDGSTDGSIDTIKDMNATVPIHYIKQMNQGQSAARNHGAKLATGDYLAFLDQDDMWYPDHLEKLSKPFFQLTGLGWTYSNLDEIDKDGNLIYMGFLNTRQAKHPKTNVLDLLKQDMFILPSASLILKQAFDECGGFDERLCGYEDDDLFLRLFRAGFRNYYIDESLSKWRIYSDSTSYSEKMARSRMIYAKKLTELFPEDEKIGRLWTRHTIAPRFLYITLLQYFNAFMEKDIERCKKLSIEYTQYMEIFSVNISKKWRILTLFLKNPQCLNFLYYTMLGFIPRRVKNKLVQLVVGL